MTWRAFIIGLLAVTGISLLEPFSSFINKFGPWFTYSSFPTGAVFTLVSLTLIVNVLLKLVRRSWAFTQAELMLVWCMVLVAAAVPCEGVGRYLFQQIAGPPYLAERQETNWDEAFRVVPEALILSKNPRDVAALKYYEGAGEEGRVPWGRWIRPLVHWALFLFPMYLAVVCLCVILRRQWVDRERLMFPLALVPLEFTEGSDGDGLLPRIFSDKAFQTGLVCTVALRLVRALPLLFGAQSKIALAIPLRAVLVGTPLEYGQFQDFKLSLSTLGFAFLVPADVSLSVWFFYLFSRAEHLLAHRLALPDAGPRFRRVLGWQQLGSFVAFIAGMVFLARRHLVAVVRKGLGLRGGADDAGESLGYRAAFWGFVAGILACLVWYRYHGMRLTAGLAALVLIFSWFFVYARMVSQGGLFVAKNYWSMPQVLHSVSFGRMFGPSGAVIAFMQSALLFGGRTTLVAPQTMSALRISSVFKKRRKLLVPILLLCLLVAYVCTCHTTLRYAYKLGAVNFFDGNLQINQPKYTFNNASRFINQPQAAVRPHFVSLSFGAVLMAFVMIMRTRFYWWPIHPIGFLACIGSHAGYMWFHFLLGWGAKVSIMKFGGGRMLRKARSFVIAMIISEYALGSFAAVLSVITKGESPKF